MIPTVDLTPLWPRLEISRSSSKRIPTPGIEAKLLYIKIHFNPIAVMKTKNLETNEPRRAGARRVVAMLISCVMWAGAGVVEQVRADISAPDNILYGAITLGTNQVTAASTSVVVEARRSNGVPIARYRMGTRSDAGNFYTLAIKVEEMAPTRESTSVLANESLNIVVTRNGTVQAQKTFVVAERGQVQRLDFGEPTTNGLTGFEAWAWYWGLDPDSQDQDADSDGLSNYAEYLAGTSPMSGASKFLLRIGKNQSSTRVSFDALRAEGAGFDGLIRHYALQQLADLHTGTWEDVTGFSDVVAANQEVVYDAPGSGAPRFFRGKAWLEGGTLDFRLLLSRDGSQITISFTASGPDEKGRDCYYTLERSPNVQPGAWVAVPGCSNVLGANQIVTVPISNDGVNPGFYRGKIEYLSP